jgi:predicted CXXCH cytochrome family protein
MKHTPPNITTRALCAGGIILIGSLAAPANTYRGPLNSDSDDVIMHMAYEMDLEDCSLCHENSNPSDPGGLNAPVNEGCMECHDDYSDALSKSVAHAPVLDKCTNCHNPHESLNPALLADKVQNLCLGCHEQMHSRIANKPVTHGVIDTERSCLNCHDPHSSDIEFLLTKLPFDLCVECHSSDAIVDHDGVRLTNFKQLLDDNKEWHAPVAAKDCSACHEPHGSDHFRLLIKDYPEKFYSPYDAELYALCFECHDDQIIADPKTVKYTQFRDGDLNLHYLHVNKSSRGRTCRACHEVHASNQANHVREGVPYGSSGWVLKLNYQRTETGGSCARTCHVEKTYNNTVSVRP